LRDTATQTFAASHVTRILILSYFLALAMGLIEGADLSRLTAPFLTAPYDTYMISGIVVALSAFILFGLLRRPAALVLSMILFWASYMTMYANGDLTGFWRDLALIGGLLMSAGVGQGQSDQRNTTVDDPETQHVQKIVSTPQPEVQTPSRRNISAFREDLNIAREA
jgi:uncharacterized membrane protein YphA (DoxX/SURF4 family)